jgi:hypothetical protein
MVLEGDARCPPLSVFVRWDGRCRLFPRKVTLMRKLVLLLIATSLSVGFVAPAQAGTIVSLVGDKDCFGLGGSCPDGTLWQDDLGGVFFTSYQTPGDPLFTDTWSANLVPPYTHTYSLAGEIPLGGILAIRFAGIGDVGGPYDVFFNGFLVGQIPTNAGPNAFQEVKTYAFSVLAGQLTGNDTVLLNINTPVFAGDGYSIDYSELIVRTNPVPEPASLLLLGTGLIGVVRAARRKRG